MAEEYILDIIKKGDDASELIHQILKATHQFSPFVSTEDPSVGGLTVLKELDPKKKIASFSLSAAPAWNKTDLGVYVNSLVSLAADRAKSLGIEPLAMTDTLDMSKIDLAVVKEAGLALYRAAQKEKIPFINGEIAGLGALVNAPFNLSGTLIGLIANSHPDGVFEKYGIHYAVFPHEGKAVFANSDGQGTKVLINQRTGCHTGMYDIFAMLADDAAKKAALIKYLSVVLEKSNNQVPAQEIRTLGNRLAGQLGVHFTLQEELLGNKIQGYGPAPYYLGGTCISLIDKKTLANMPTPKPGDFLVAFRDPNNLNFRSNGITKLRQGLEEIFGPEYQNAIFQGENVGELANRPSVILYPFFKEMLDQGLVTGVYHMSGGSHQGKLARPLAKAGLRANIGDLFDPHPLIDRLVEHFNMSWQDAYSIWPMNTDGFVATPPNKAVETLGYLKGKGFDARTVGALESRALTINLPGERGKIEYNI